MLLKSHILSLTHILIYFKVFEAFNCNRRANRLSPINRSFVCIIKKEDLQSGSKLMAMKCTKKLTFVMIELIITKVQAIDHVPTFLHLSSLHIHHFHPIQLDTSSNGHVLLLSCIQRKTNIVLKCEKEIHTSNTSFVLKIVLSSALVKGKTTQ